MNLIVGPVILILISDIFHILNYLPRDKPQEVNGWSKVYLPRKNCAKWYKAAWWHTACFSSLFTTTSLNCLGQAQSTPYNFLFDSPKDPKYTGIHYFGHYKGWGCTTSKKYKEVKMTMKLKWFPYKPVNKIDFFVVLHWAIWKIEEWKIPTEMEVASRYELLTQNCLHSFYYSHCFH